MPAFETDRLIQGDCVAGMRGLPEASVDLAFADPPFNIGYGYDVYQTAAQPRITWIGHAPGLAKWPVC